MRFGRSKESGLLSLEASISVTIFIFLMLFFYSFFVVFEVRNEIGHVTLSTANSMALDAFENETIGNSDTFAKFLYEVYGQNTNSMSDFSAYRRWYETVDDKGKTTMNKEFSGVIKDRFIAFLTGGNKGDAENILKRYHVVDGVNGLDFSGSYVSDDNLYLSVKYKIEYEFNVFNLLNLEFEQHVCSKLWK